MTYFIGGDYNAPGSDTAGSRYTTPMIAKKGGSDDFAIMFMNKDQTTTSDSTD